MISAVMVILLISLVVMLIKRSQRLRNDDALRRGQKMMLADDAQEF